ncbi:hypothetical protein [Microbulbifer discodermiae]|uniref:hypothetical protein n=1 Tax=Microbulbifer sp. 2201CG32-9 TaxID=3232309 RepID=UPI00345BAAE9
MKYIISVVAMVCVSAGLALAQQLYTVAQLSAVPIWPEDGVIPPRLSGQYVFLDPGSGQMVLVYPRELDKPGTQATGELRVERLNLGNQVKASISSKVKVKKNSYAYSYTLRNAKGARQAIANLKIPVPNLGQDDEVLAPGQWQSAKSESQVRALQMAIWSTSGYFISWYNYDAEKREDGPKIGAGQQLSGFYIGSELKPGITTAYVGSGHYPAMREAMPQAVLEQAVPLMSIEANNQDLLTIAPRFSRDTHKLIIAGNFHFGISRMVTHGQLDGNSPAVREALQVLNYYAEAAEAAGEVELADFVGPRMRFSQKPRPGLEAEVLHALMISLE